MKRMTHTLLAIAMLVAVPAFLTSCQEDAPEINYTVNVTIVNDFSSIIDAINNGTLQNDDAIKQLTDAIDRMSADQAGKLQAIVDALVSAGNTLEAKLAALEAAINAQTLSLEGKLALIETALNTGFMDQETALGEIKTVLEALNGSVDGLGSDMDAAVKAIADALADIFNAIDGQPDYGEILAAIKTAIENLETGNANAFVVDGTKFSLSYGVIDKSNLDRGKYYLWLYQEGRDDYFINIMADREYHDGKIIDLTQKEPKRPDGVWYWAVTCRVENYVFLNAFAHPNSSLGVFQSGTLYMKRLADNADGLPVFEIRLDNGRIVEVNDGLEHTVSLFYSGPLDLIEL